MRAFVVMVAALFVSGTALAMNVWTGVRTQPGSIYYHGPNNIPWNADTGKYVGWDAGPTAGSAYARSSYNASIGRVPLVIEGRQIATSAAIAAGLRGLARVAGPVGLGLTVAELLWDATNGWRTQTAGSHSLKTWANYNNSSQCQTADAQSTANCIASSMARTISSCSLMYSGSLAYRMNCGLVGGGTINAEYYFKCYNGIGGNYWMHVVDYGTDSPSWCTDTSPTTYAAATDAQLELALQHAMEAAPASAPSMASQAEAAGANITLGDLALTGPASLSGGTSTSTTTDATGTTTVAKSDTYNLTYNTNNVYNQTTTVTTTTYPDNSTSTTTTTTGANPPAQEKAPAEATCGSLSCEETQLRIETELKAATAATLPDQAGTIQTAKDQDKSSSDATAAAIAGEVTADTSRWFAWVWTPPGGTCQAPVAHLSQGITVSYDFCPFVDNIRAALGWLLALFGSWHVYGVLFRARSA